MGVKDLMKLKQYNEGSIMARLDKFLATNVEESDRAINVNSPSQVFKCKRALYYARTGEETDGFINARLQRIFDNGTHMHIRIQEYLKKEGTLLLDECPCIDKDTNIQGHTDGILKISEGRLAILELKSMNSILFNKLKEPKPEHIAQAMIYMYCTECRRLDLQAMTDEEYLDSLDYRKKFYANRYDHLQGGKKYSKEEKIDKAIEDNIKLDDLLYYVAKFPIDSIYFMYENKDNQDIKEFKIEYDDDLMCDILDFYDEINYYVTNKELPPREGTGKSCQNCRYCSYKNSCYIV